ncbi:hypothetical protein CY34DRAFT_97328, partial [Suillus luteus UH-Slu-Lm8-n1]
SKRSQSPRNRRRSASPGTSKRHSTSRNARSANQRMGFPEGAHSSRSSAVCAVCLGKHSHSFIECSNERLWNSAHPALATRVNKHSNKPLCVDWQRSRSCTSRSHDERHVCSGCLATSHGAQNCPRAQT